MPVKPRIDHTCPGCGNSALRQTTRKGEGYTGPWLECLVCEMQGPRSVWDQMKRRRKTLQESLALTQLSASDKAYLNTIEEFGQKMYRELKANEPEKGNFLLWKPDREGAISELEHHIVKLVAAINRGSKVEISEYSADVGNIAMSIDKNLGTV